jgi:hypothetical protein
MSAGLPSLTQLFEAPDNFRGEAGVVCGFSADSVFMDVALERFTRLTAGQRGAEGKIRLALVLDPGNPQIVPDSVPGMLHLPVLQVRPPLGLLHAKIALLLFRRTDRQEPATWVLRLIVCTGNWTRQTVNQSIDLFWRAELSSEDLNQPTDIVQQDVADLVAAWDFLSWILQKCCGQNPKKPSEHLPMLGDMEQAIQKIKKLRRPGSETRFFDNREVALIDQVVARAKAAGGQKSNYLALGSGFFNDTETGENPGEDTLQTIEGIRNTFTEAGLVTRQPELDLVVNPGACQGVASAAATLREKGWTIRPPTYLGQPTDRFLHAKFVFSAVARNGEACRPWLYLGSGNITRQGFMSKAGPGNLEAGVLLRTKTLQWECDRRHGDNSTAVSYMLPLRWEVELTPEDGLAAGEGMENRDAAFIAPPIPFLRWAEADDGGWLSPPDSPDPVQAYTVTGAEGQVCEQIDCRFRWLAAQPRQVQVRWDGGNEAIVPVIGQDGRIAGAPLHPRRIDELWGDLEGFPEPPNAEEDDQGDDLYDELGDKAALRHLTAQAVASTTLIRSTMDLVEKIASRQTRLSQNDWTAWCVRLEQTLFRAAKTTEVAEFQRLKVNPLSPLRHPAFRPAFAQADGPDSALYDTALSDIELAWNIVGLRHVGAKS